LLATIVGAFAPLTTDAMPGSGLHNRTTTASAPPFRKKSSTASTMVPDVPNLALKSLALRTMIGSFTGPCSALPRNATLEVGAAAMSALAADVSCTYAPGLRNSGMSRSPAPPTPKAFILQYPGGGNLKQRISDTPLNECGTAPRIGYASFRTHGANVLAGGDASMNIIEPDVMTHGSWWDDVATPFRGGTRNRQYRPTHNLNVQTYSFY
jgi:hypothetical protein